MIQAHNKPTVFLNMLFRNAVSFDPFRQTEMRGNRTEREKTVRNVSHSELVVNNLTSDYSFRAISSHSTSSHSVGTFLRVCFNLFNSIVKTSGKLFVISIKNQRKHKTFQIVYTKGESKQFKPLESTLNYTLENISKTDNSKWEMSRQFLWLPIECVGLCTFMHIDNWMSAELQCTQELRVKKDSLFTSQFKCIQQLTHQQWIKSVVSNDKYRFKSVCGCLGSCIELRICVQAQSRRLIDATNIRAHHVCMCAKGVLLF